jgi:NTE family protein
MENGVYAGTLFDVIGEEGWASLRAHMERREYAPGEVLIARGTLEPEFHIVTTGTVSVTAKSPQGVRRELGALGPGESIGDMSLLTGEPASADVVATTPVTTYAIAQDRLAGMGETRSRLIEALAMMLASRLRHANERLVAQHSADIHLVRCPADIAPSIVRLPAEMAAVVDAAVLVVLAGNAYARTVADAMAGDRVSVWALDDGDIADLPRMLQRVSHEYDQAIVISETEPEIGAIEAVSRVSVRDEHSGTTGDVVVVTERPWTQPAVRDLSARLRANVVGVVPVNGKRPAHGDNVRKLARVLTKRQVGVALGAGAAKGLAHIGVLRALDDMGIEIDVVSGTSIGSAIAGGFAAGYELGELTEIVARIAARAVRPTVPLHSFLSNKGLRDELERVGGGRRFEDLDIPLAICATDIFRRCDVTFTSGPVWPRILASMAIPGIYPALRGRNSYLVDGGVLNPVPSKQCRDLGAGIVIGVRLTGRQTSPRDELEGTPSRPLATETIMRCLEIMHNRVSELSGTDADATIEVCIDKGGLRDFSRASEIAEAGYDGTIAARDTLAAVMPYTRKAPA